MVDPSSFDDLFEQPTSDNQHNATQDLDSGSSDTFDYGSSSDSSSDSDSDLNDSGNSDGSRHSEPKEGVIKAYLTMLKASLSDQIGPRSKQLPDCYKQGQFWIHPRHPFFSMDKAAISAGGITPESLYFPDVFVWIPTLLNGDNKLVCKDHKCVRSGVNSKELSIKGFNDNPIASRVITLDSCYYILTQRVECSQKSGGCGKSWNLCDPMIMEQLDPGLAACFPAFLTHRSGIDKTIITLIRAGMAHSLSSNAWSKILRELHLREHDLRELTYLYAIQKEESKHNVPKAYPLFSKFEDKSGYAGLAPHRSYITTLYIDFIEHVRHVLDQCVAALPAGIIKWDHSFKVPKFMMKLNGTVTFSSLFSLENEFSQLRYQSFVPTKSLSHVRTALEDISKSLKDHGLLQPNLGFTDNVASEYATFVEIFPSLSEGVKAVHLDEFSDLPRMILPSHVIVAICTTEIEIQTACDSILELALEKKMGA